MIFVLLNPYTKSKIAIFYRNLSVQVGCSPCSRIRETSVLVHQNAESLTHTRE